MKKSLYVWQIAGFVFTGIIGVLLHFLFEWTNQSIVAAPFSAVNESTWEHMKILFFPMFVFALMESRYVGKDYKNFWCIKFIGIVVGLMFIPVLYYTIKGIFGTSPDWVNIAIFFVASAISYLLETWLLERNSINCKWQGTALLVLILIVLSFVILTFIPPHIPLFEDPITKTYGYIK